MARGRELLLRDELLHCLQMHGKQCAQELARRVGRNEKSVMRSMTALSDAGMVVYADVREMRVQKLRYWCVRSTPVRYYWLPIMRMDADPWMKRWVKR
ncbi:hypothetical protein A7P95_07300 [Eikenella longinqua]|uniref:Uncharacterized protein n=2 Tax=Eikenella longinqua TaxID=1795827 RepID=A0A1A9RWI2_9NEIS|nr:hypothetical protein A7P95_07300 [Eikenella longinqua]